MQTMCEIAGMKGLLNVLFRLFSSGDVDRVFAVLCVLNLD